jgi:hypothetical protein
MAAGPHWGAWSRAAVRLMQARSMSLVEHHGLQGRGGRWDLAEARLVFPGESDEVVADLCLIGTLQASEARFVWAWANRAIPPTAWQGLDRVREFGEMNALDALTTPEWPAGRAEAFELAAVAARVLYAAAVWLASSGDLTFFFALSNPRRVSRAASH